VALTIEKTIDSLNAKLRDLSCKIHGKLKTPVATSELTSSRANPL
jgi:hypothetical protein